MKLNRCPICHSLFDVMTLAQDEATQEIMVKLAKLDTQAGTALLSYLSLFCPPKSQLSADRSLTLINELETLENGNWQRLGLAMATVSAVMQDKKREGKPVSQFKNHNYLKKVLAEMDTQPPALLPTTVGGVAPTGLDKQPQGLPKHQPSQMEQGISALQAMKR